MVFNPALTPGSYHTYTEEQLAELSRRAEQKAVEAKKLDAVFRANFYRQDPDGRPLPPPDQNEEQRLETSDLREPLREAQSVRNQCIVAVRDHEAVLAKAREHLEDVTGSLLEMEADAALSEKRAAERLARSFAGVYDACGEESGEDGAIAAARAAVERAETAVGLLETEAEEAQHALDVAQERVVHAVLDVVKSEILRLGREAAGLDQAAAQIRSDLEQAGYATANLQRRYRWSGTIFTTSTRHAKQKDPNARPPAPSLDWTGFVERLMTDAGAVLE